MTSVRAARVLRVALATVPVVVASLLVPGPAAAAPGTAPAPVTAPVTTPVTAPVAAQQPVRSPCATSTAPATDDVQCLAVERATPGTATPDVGTSGTVTPRVPVPDGISPTQLRTVYGVQGMTAPAGTTVGIVVAYDAPVVEANLATFRSTFGLPACTTANGCFRKVDQRGKTVPAGKSQTSTVAPVYRDDGWQLETTLDTQAVSAMCPSCRILLVEADNAGLTTGLGPAVARAAALGSTVIANSFAGGESQDMVSAEASYWSKAGVPVFAASGDHGWNNLDLASGATGYNYANYPATSPSVISVGGTSATVSGTTVTSETAWSDAGSGCSYSFARPAFQTAYFAAQGTRPDTRCGTAAKPTRATADLSAMADPYAPGFPVYRGSSWTVAGGTSLSVQLVAALAAYAGRRGPGSSVGTVAYGLAAVGAPTGLTDITAGTNRPAAYNCGGERICTAGAGWDGPTGLGTPRGISLFAPLLTVAPPSSVQGGTVQANGSSFVPGEQVQLTSGGTALGAVTVAADGTYSTPVTLPTGASGSVPVTATGVESGFTATDTVTAAALTVLPATQTVRTGAAASLQLTGFGVREPVTATADSGGAGAAGVVVASVTTTGGGAGTLTWKPSATAPGNGTQRVVVRGATSGRSVTVFVALAATGATLPDAPTVLSAVPTTSGAALVGVRIAGTGVPATTVAVIGSDGSLSARTPVPSGRDAFVTVPTLAPGATVTYTAVAGTVSGDSVASVASPAVTGSNEAGTGDLTPVGPVRIYDSRTVAAGALGAGVGRTVQVTGTAGVPADGVAAVVLSVTAMAPTVSSSLTVWPTGQPRPSVYTAATTAGRSRGTLVKVQVGAGGLVSVFNAAGSVGLILDLVGFYAAGPQGSENTSVYAHNASYAGLAAPTRVADTRTLGSGSPLRSAGGTLAVPVRGGRTGVPADAVAVELQVQTLNSTGTGSLIVTAGGLRRPGVASAQVTAGVPAVTAVLSRIGADGTVAVYASAATDVIVEIIGYDAPSATGRYVPLAPRRYLDTRATGGGGPFAAGVSRPIPIAGATARDGSSLVPSSATAVSFQLTSTGNTAATYEIAWAAGLPKPTATALVAAAASVSYDNLALSDVGAGGAVTLANNSGSVSLIVDVRGYYTDGLP